MSRALGPGFTRLIEHAPEVRRRILCVLVIGVPVAFLRFTSDPFNVPKLVLLITGVGCVLVLRVTEILQGRSWRGPQILAVPALVIAAPMIVSWAFSPYRGWAILGLQGRFQGLAPYLIVILLGILIADAFRGHVNELAFMLLWAGAVVGGYAVIQTLGLDPFDWDLYGAPTEAISTTGNPNFTGGFLGIVLPIGLGLTLADPARRRVAIRLLVCALAGWIVARSQGGWAAGIAGSAIVAGYLLRDRYRLSYLAGWLVAFLVAAATIGVVLVAMVRPESRFTTGAAVDRSAWSEAAFGMGLASPIVGRGPNSFAIEGVSTRPLDDALEFNFDFPDDPHSVPMSMFANLGIIGLTGFFAILGWSLWYFRRIEEPSLLQVAFVGAVVAYFVQSLVSIDELTLRAGLWSALGGLVAASVPEDKIMRRTAGSKARARGASSRIRPVKVQKPRAVAALVVTTLVGIAWAGSILVADVYVRQGSKLFAAGEVEAGRAKYESALSLRDSADYRGRLAFVLKDLAFAGGEVDRAMVAAADAAFSFTEEVPYLFSIVSRARMLEAAEGEVGGSEEALALYRSAISIDPLNPLLRVETALVLGELDRHQEAFELLRAQKDVIGDIYPQYWGALALEAAEVGENEIARDALEVAISLEPTQPEALEARKLLGLSTEP